MNTDGNLAALREYEKWQDALDCRGFAIEEVVEEIFDDDTLLADAIRDADPRLTIEKVVWAAAEVALENRFRGAEEAAAEAAYELMAGGR